MELSTQTTLSPHQIKTAALGLGVYADGTLSTVGQALDRAAGGLVSATIKTDFDGATGATLVLRHLPGIKAERVILVGLGKADQYSPEVHARAELAFAQACVQARVEEAVSELATLPCENSTLHQRAQRAAASYGRALYRYTATFGKPDTETAPRLNKVTLLVGRSHAAEAQKGLKEGRAIANGMDLTRTLGNLPGNICTPRYLADTARKLAKEFKSIKVEVLDQKEIQALGMGSFLSVAKGSDEPPRFIILRHQAKKTGKGSDKAPHVLVGKGITFDSGGISIKPAATMDEMKYDMCGAASVLGTFRALGELDLPLNVVGLIAACENLPSGRANKPGDVVTSMSGQTIEILNTDAEGRLVLCDALTYAERLKPASVVDIATLTGACVVALGHVNSGLFSTDQALADSLQAAGRTSLDTVWQLPIQDAYQEQLKSRFADIANIGGPAAGSVTAACFLSRFTKAYRWAHLDIAGTAWQSGKDKGATGRPVPLLTQYLLDQVR